MLRRTFLKSLLQRKEPTIPEPTFRGRKSVYKTIAIHKPGTYDFKNTLHEWKGQKWGRDTEYGPAILHIFVSDVTIKNFAYAGSPDGIHIGALPWSSANAIRQAPRVENVRFENIQAIDIREDALTLQMGTQGITLKNCQFWGAHDKVIQNDHCKDLSVIGCSFYGGARPIRFKARTSGTIENCRFLKNAQAIKTDGLPWPENARQDRLRPGGKTTVRVQNCLFYQSSIVALDSGKNSKIHAKHNTFIRCHQRKR